MMPVTVMFGLGHRRQGPRWVRHEPLPLPSPQAAPSAPAGPASQQEALPGSACGGRVPARPWSAAGGPAGGCHVLLGTVPLRDLWAPLLEEQTLPLRGQPRLAPQGWCSVMGPGTWDRSSDLTPSPLSADRQRPEPALGAGPPGGRDRGGREPALQASGEQRPAVVKVVKRRREVLWDRGWPTARAQSGRCPFPCLRAGRPLAPWGRTELALHEPSAAAGEGMGHSWPRCVHVPSGHSALCRGRPPGSWELASQGLQALVC